VAKAKLYEHFLKDEEEALVWAKRAREIALAEGMEEDGAQSDMRGSALTIEAIDHRIARLARKIAKMNSLSAR